MFGLMHPADHLMESIGRSGSISVVGLDIRPRLVPPPIRDRVLAERSGVGAVLLAFDEFGRGVIDVASGACAAIKFQSACYEAYGSAGVAVLERLLAYARSSGTPVIVDSKRGDIGSTAEHYREALFDGPVDFSGVRTARGLADWITVNCYLGRDGIEPFLVAKGAQPGAFALLRTSNPSADEIQMAGNDRSVLVAGADMIRSLGSAYIGASGLSALGAVVGATKPAEASWLRDLLPQAIFLVPGFGAQGASASDAVTGATDAGDGIIVNSSRALLGAWQHAAPETDWKSALASALLEMNGSLMAAMAARTQ